MSKLEQILDKNGLSKSEWSSMSALERQNIVGKENYRSGIPFAKGGMTDVERQSMIDMGYSEEQIKESEDNPRRGGRFAKGGKTDGDTLGDFKKRLLQLGDKEFVEYKEKQLKKQDLYYAFKDRLKDVHKQTIVVKDDLPFKKGGALNSLKKQMNDDLDIHSEYYAKGGRTISIVNDGVKYDKSKYKAVYGDYDKDGIVNIDDANPLDKNKKGKVNEEIELKETFDKLLSVKAELDDIMYDAVDTLDEKAPKGADIYARTKTPYSILKKLVEKRMLDPKKGLTDMIGTTIAVENQNELEQVRDDIDSGLLGKVLDRDDFYKSPNAGYRAYHYIVEYKGVPVEVQLKTKNMKKLHQVSHSAYKKGNLDGKKLDAVSILFMKADKGDAKSKTQINKLLKNKKLLTSKVTKKITAKAKKKSMAKGGKTKSTGAKRKTPMTLAKEIRKEGEKWQDAVKRASAILKKEVK